MLKMALRSAWRILTKTKLLSSVKIFGLALGTTVFLLTILYALSEWRFDRQHHDPNSIYRYVHRVNTPEGIQSFAFSSGTIGPLLKEKFPSVMDYTRFINVRVSVRNESKDITFNEKYFGFADSTFFRFFNFRVRGNPNYEQLLKQPQVVILTPASALKYFGKENAVGETLLINNRIPVTVVGVFEEEIRESHLRFDFLASMLTLEVIGNDPVVSRQINASQQLNNKGFAAFYNYIRLASKDHAEVIISGLPAFIEDTRGKGRSERLKPTIQSLISIHLDSDLLYEIQPNGSAKIVWVYVVIGFLVLAIACINYINISTAELLQRSRSTALRKILGVTKTSLIWSQLTETCLLAMVGLWLGWGLGLLVLPFFNSMIDREISLLSNDACLLLSLLFGGIVLLSGLYPAIRIGQAPTLDALRSNNMAPSAKWSFRSILVLFQLMVSFSLLTLAMLVYEQIGFMLDQPLGFDAARIVVVNAQSASHENRLSLKQEILKTQGIEAVTLCSTPPGEPLFSFGLVLPEDAGEEERRILFYQSYVDADYLKVMGLTMANGRFFDVASPGDSSHAIIMNVSGSKAIGGNVLNRTLNIPNFFTPGARPKEVLGLVDDFHFASMRSTVQPLVLEYNPARCGYLMIHLSQGALVNRLGSVASAWNRVLPGVPFDYYFMDDEFRNDFNGENQLRSIMFSLAAISILLAALGIFGSLFMVQSRTREVATQGTGFQSVPTC